MGNRHEPTGPLEALFGKVRREILTLLFGRPGEGRHLLEIVRAARSGRGGVQRELARLAAAGLVTRQRRGNLVVYQANPECPLFGEMRALVEAGVARPARSTGTSSSGGRPDRPEARGGLPID
ncbi:MAG: winged helix-turn-helix transcriptional regulator [Candidatus Wallbacteria bacterium]|nr:winged helix-turn-helix transcriptional regulator [Candidatus Wallbacteria bacterium]